MKTMNPPASWQFAKGTLTRGTDAFGSEELDRVFGVKVEAAEMPFSEPEILRARELGQSLVLFSSATGTMQTIHRACGNKLGLGKLLYDPTWYQSEEFFTTETATDGWKFVSRDVIPGSLGKDYLGQTAIIADYLRDRVYRGEELPAPYAEAIAEFEERKKVLGKLIRSDWKKGAEEAAALQLNQLFRGTPVEELTTIALAHEMNGEYLLPDRWSWTKRRASGGRLVYVGHADGDGVGVGRDDPGRSLSLLGVRFFRSPILES